LKYFRSCLLLICFLIFGIGSFFVNFIIFPASKLLLPPKNRNDFYSIIIQRTWRFLIFLLESLRLIKLDIKDLGALESIKNKVIVATHPSFIDIVILMAFIPKTTCFAKEKIATHPLLKNILSTIFITDNIDIDGLKEQSKKMLDFGFNVIIFPSGIRHRKGEYPKIKKGASLIALNSKKNIIPIKLYSDDDFLFINQPFYEAGESCVTFTVEVLPEIDINTEIKTDDIIAKKNITNKIEKSLYN
jgi:1-acyl-sn-glycerol-3-phosphate acyltransferase